MAILDLQQRYRELGRIRLGEKVTRNGKTYPGQLSTFRFTSPSKALIETAAERFGGTVVEWTDAPTDGSQWQVTSKASEIDVLVPMQDITGGQHYEMWTAGGCERRCDGVIESISGRDCMCDPDDRACRPTTHLLLMVPEIPDLGVWRITSHGIYAAIELPTAINLLSHLLERGGLVKAQLAIAHRTSKTKDPGGKSLTRKFTVPEIRIPYTMTELAEALGPDGEAMMLGVGSTKPQKPSTRPELPSVRPELPDNPAPIATPDELINDTVKPKQTDWDLLYATIDVIPTVKDAMPKWVAYCEQLFVLMERVGAWPKSVKGVDPLTMALGVGPGYSSLREFDKPGLVEFVTKAHTAAAEKAAEYAPF